MGIQLHTTQPLWAGLGPNNPWCLESCYEARVAGFVLAIGKDPAGAQGWCGFVMNESDDRYKKVFSGCGSRVQAEEVAVIELVRLMGKIAFDCTYSLIGGPDMVRDMTDAKAKSALKDAEYAAAERRHNVEAAQPPADSAPGAVQADPTHPGQKAVPGGTMCDYCGMPYYRHPAQGAGYVAVCNKGKVAIK